MSTDTQQETQSTQQKEMTKEEAHSILSQVGAQYKGNLQEHIAIQSALSILAKAAGVQLPVQPAQAEQVS